MPADNSSLAYFEHPDGKPYKAGEILRQPDLAKTLRAISAEGARGFYEGPVAKLIEDEMKQGGGLIAAEDLRNYKPIEREPVRGTYRGYDIVSMPPPSSGGVHVIQILNILEGYDLAKLGHNTADSIHRLAEAMRRAYADRAKWLGDPGFVKVPVAGLVSKDYARQLRAGIDLSHASQIGGRLGGQAARRRRRPDHAFFHRGQGRQRRFQHLHAQPGLRQRLFGGWRRLPAQQ